MGGGGSFQLDNGTMSTVIVGTPIGGSKFWLNGTCAAGQGGNTVKEKNVVARGIIFSVSSFVEVILWDW